MWHLLIHLFFEGYREAQRQRQVEAEPVVLLCPLCGHLGVARVIRQEVLRPNSTTEWIADHEEIICHMCDWKQNASHFENDGQGVLRVRTSPCGKCGEPVPCGDDVCKACSAKQ